MLVIEIDLFRKPILIDWWFRPRRPRIATGQLFFSVGEKSMSSLVVHADSNGAKAAVAFKDKKGNPAAPVAVNWSSSDTSIATVVGDALDGSNVATAQIAFTGAVGSVTIDMLAEGDAVAGKDQVHQTGDIQVVAAEIATGDLSFTENP